MMISAPRARRRARSRETRCRNKWRSRLPEIGLENFELLARADIPFLRFETGHVHFPLHTVIAGRAEKMRFVMRRAVLHRAPGSCRRRCRSCGAAPARKARCSAGGTGEIDDLLADRPAHVAESEQLDREVLREDDEVTFVVDRGVDQRDYLVAKLIEGLDRPDEVLQRGDMNSFHHGP